MSNETILGVPVFEWDGWDIADEHGMLFYKCQFSIEELKQFDGYTVEMQFMSPTITIWELPKTEADIKQKICEVNVLAIPEFINKLNDLAKNTEPNNYEFKEQVYYPKNRPLGDFEEDSKVEP